jgi:hypothetical protein
MNGESVRSLGNGMRLISGGFGSDTEQFLSLLMNHFSATSAVWLDLG